MGRQKYKSKDNSKVTSKTEEAITLSFHQLNITEKHHRRSARLATRKTRADQAPESLAEASQPQPSATPRNFTMRLATALPSRVAVNRAISTPVVVLFDQNQEDVPSTDDIWVFASLIEESSGNSAREDLLQGQRADSMHALTAHQAEFGRNFAYASFPNLLITQSGRYRLRVTAIDMKR